ncbi:hypothetical protein [Proteiniphilum acetatigenes]|uniref:hypothetical protein n=1 Tax=Proteiniphilum acetatigenes TaxID=294710 RepID=UPI000373C3DF|nr:hypothetical protein [Proteiniphilum acetatigenes]
MIKVYRKISGVETEICEVSAKQSVHKTAIRGVNEIQISVTVDEMLPIQEGDYVKLGGVNYTLNRDVEYTIESDVKYSYDLVFEHPFYVLLNKLYCNRITGDTTFTLTGKLRDFVELLIWCINITPGNPDGVDTGWAIGEIIDTDYKNLTFSDLNGKEVLDKLADEFQAEYYFNNKQINFVERIERITDHSFQQGAGKGLYALEQQNVDKEDTVTRLIVRGGNQNVPNEYADNEGYLKLPENYLEDFSEHSKVVEKKKRFEEEFPKFVGTVATVSGDNNKILTCPQIDFDVAAVAVGDNARINFLTGDLLGVPFKFQWQNSNKQITLIEQEDETALAGADGTKPTIPNSSKKAKVGDEFNFTGVLMPESYVTASITRLRNKGNKYLNLFSKKRVKFSLDIDYRYMRNKPELIIGDLVVISIPQRNFYQVIRITELEKNLHTGAISATVSNYLEENWEKYVESKVNDVRNEILAKQVNVRNTLETIFRDGIVTESELAIIQSVLDRLYIERGQMNAQYLVIRGNINLINKTPLTNAWSAYQTAYTSVTDAISSAIADGKITEAEKNDIDSKLAAYATQLNAFSSALEQARQDIEDYKNQAILDVAQDNIDHLQQQIDGEVSNWFDAYSPTLSNYPASDWTTDTEKDRHIGDTFTNTQPSPAADAGKSWRFVKNGSVYSWTQIADSDAVKALQQAAQAQATADGKSTTFLVQPSNYHLGDTWVLNADRTVNGTAYKQGEILTATQDSTTFVEAHWIKRVRYTDQDAIDKTVDNLQIGGRNYLLNSANWNNILPNHSTNWPIAKGVEDGVNWVYGRDATDNQHFISTYGPLFSSLANFSVLLTGQITTSVEVMSAVAMEVALGSGTYRTLTPNVWTRISRTENNPSRMPTLVTKKSADIAIGTKLYYRNWKVELGGKAMDWSPAPEDVQAAIDEAVVKATYWSVKASAPVIYKDAINAATSGTHTPVTVSGELRSGTTTTSGGFITVTPNGGAEAGTASASPVTIAPANGDGKTSYTVRLYDTAAKTTLLDTMTIPVVFKGASGVNAINVVLSNEADVLPASPEGVVSDYSGSGTIIRVFEGATELDYDGIGTANGKFNVTASATGITAGAKSESGLTCVFANASNMTADNATITFTIIGKTSAGASFSLIKTQTFAKSRTGQKGDAGVSITGVDVEFAKNTSPTTAPTTGWTTTAPTLLEGEQLWTRTKTAYSSGNPTYSTPANITPKKGDTGAVGQGVDSVTEEYAISTSKTTQPTTGWSTTQPTWSSGMYIWSRVKVVYKNPASTIYTGYAVSSEWEAVNALEIGGRNLLLNSNFKTGSYNGWISVYGTHQITQDGYIKTYTSVSAAARIEKAFTLSKIGTFTFSVKVKTNVAISWYNWDGLSIQDIKVKLIEDDFEIHSITFTNTDAGSKIIRGYQPNAPIGTTTLIEWEKLEKGNKATDYSPAPEDVQAEIDTEKTRINDILSDNVADPSEKQYLSNLWQEIYAEYPRIWAQANTYAVDKSNYEAKYTALNNLLSPVLANLTVNSTVSGASIRTAFSEYYDAKTFLLNNITNKVNTTAADALEKANTSKAITDKFGTTVDGGLISTVMMVLRELNSSYETAGISGIQGVLRNNPAYWSGGTYAQALALIQFLSKMSAGTTPGANEYANLAKITMLHNGAAKVGDFIIEESGRIVMVDPSTGKPRLIFGVFNIPTVANLLSETQLGQSVNTGSGAVNMTTPQVTLSGSVTVSQDNSTLTFGGTLMTITVFRGPGLASANVALKVYRNGILYANIAGVSVSVSSGESGYNEVNTGVKVLTGVPTGTYTLRAELTWTGDPISIDGGVPTSTLAWSFSKNVEYFQFGLDGMMSWWQDFHVHMSRNGGFDGRAAADKWNTPGVLAAGSSTSGGVQSNVWGAKSNAGGITIISGGFRVPLSNMSHNKYVVQITPHTNTTFRVGTKTNANFEIFGTGGFDYVVIGNNYNT